MVTGSGVVEDSRRSFRKEEEKPATANYGLFLGGGSMPPKPSMVRAKTADPRSLGDQGVSIGSNDSGAAKAN